VKAPTRWAARGDHHLRELKKKLYLCLMSVNALEAIRFYVSFACSFAFAERELMEGNAKIIKMIARDEALHLTGTQHMLNLMRTGQSTIPRWRRSPPSASKPASRSSRKPPAGERVGRVPVPGRLHDRPEQGHPLPVRGVHHQPAHEAVGLTCLSGAKQNPIPWINTWLSPTTCRWRPRKWK
jgi:ribonucleoside-diphosphate reductase beta chain